MSAVRRYGACAPVYAYSPACTYCGGALGPGDDGVHVECAAEWLCRAGRNECVACGGADTAGYDYWCRKCAAAKSMRYVGYPGGA